MQAEIKRLRKRFVFTVIIIVSLMMALVFGVVCMLTSAAIKNSGMDVLRRVVNSPTQFGRLERFNDDIQLPYFVLLTDETHSILTSYGGYFDQSETESMQAALEVAINSEEDFGFISEYGLRYMKVQGPMGIQTIAFVDVSSQIETLDHIQLITMMVCISCIAVFAVLALILSKWVVKPVESSWQQQKQFVSDASHELKTPLTVIMTNAEMMAMDDCSEEDQKKYNNNILTVSHQMKGLVEDMLNLARLEKGESQTFEKLDLGTVFNDVIMQFEPVLFELGLSIEQEISADVYVKGSVQRLGQLLSILLDNAGKYSKTSPVKVSLKKQGKQAVLTVSNPSDPMSDKQLSDIFKRFYRKDESHHEKSSYGLGLAIAQSICEAHGGKIHAEYKDGLIYFIIVIPCL